MVRIRLYYEIVTVLKMLIGMTSGSSISPNNRIRLLWSLHLYPFLAINSPRGYL